ncbi:MAG: hypothetical protein ABSF22_13040, partial [Bryobacteraceae bacterium]
LTVSKGIAIALGVALVATLGLVWFTNALAFSSTSITIARVVLFLALAAALGFALVLPLLRLNRNRTADRAESTFPEFNQRLLTFIERGEARDPMLELLASDAVSVANKTEPERVAPRKNIFAFATAGGAAGAVLLWLILAGPGFLGYGSSLLWAGLPKGINGANFYDIMVEPGNKLVRRKSDQMITATLTGFQAPQVRLFARYKSTSKWEEASMLPRSSGTAYEFLFAALPEPVEYYVEAAGVKSKTFKLDVADLPGIKNIKVTYHYPSWLNLKDVVEDPGGDLRAVAGTVAELTIETDRPLKNGEIQMDDGSHIALESKNGNFVVAKVPVEKDGMYHFAAVERGENVRLSEDYFIEARQDQAPTVKIVTPRGDAKVSPIEEVTVSVEAADDFALESMELHYSVNGAPEKTVNLLPNRGVKEANGKTLISLEDYKLEAGDVVSIYATARDARNTARTDIAFIETQPFEKNYSQSQSQGGSMGMPNGGDDQTEISRRQKEIIAATWNEIRGGAKDKVNSAENAKFLAGIQTKLKEQAKSLAERARSRELAGANQEFQSFVKDLDEAAKQMDPASAKLGAQSWKDALEPEQKALQHLLRAEATFRDIQVAFGGQSGGGGGGQNAGRDLANLFDLELDTEKNQYESGQQQSGGQAKEKAIDEALQKLEQLAQRQKQLAEQEAKSKQQTFEQRWQQEMLRREAEELKKQMEQLSRDGLPQQGGQQQGQQQSASGGQTSGQSGQSSDKQSQGGQMSPQQGQSGKQQQNGQSGKSQPQQQAQRSLGQRNNTNDQRLQQALDRLAQATDDMREAQRAGQQPGQPSGQQSGQQQKGGSQEKGQPEAGGQSGQAQANARRAAEHLQDAQSMLNGMRRQESSSQLGDLEQRAENLAGQQRDFANRMRKEFGGQALQGGPVDRQKSEQMAAEKEKMATEVDRLETDMKKAARDLASTQPDASARVRDGLSEIQQNEAKRRMMASAQWIRQGQGGAMISREAPVTQALDKTTEDLKQAQSALKNGAQGQGTNDLERSLARVERMRNQMERMSGAGQKDQNGQPQNGQQPGGQQAGGQQPGQQQGGQQSGGQQGGGNQPGNSQSSSSQQGGGYGDQGSAARGGGTRQYGSGLRYGRFMPEGVYDAPLDRPADPNEAIRNAARDLNDMRQLFKDNPDIQKEITEVEHEIQKLTVGEIATAELQQRLNREVLPNLQALEVKLRRQVEEQGGGQVKSGATDKVPAGFSDAVAEYFRKLSKGN